MDWKSLQDTPPWEWPEGASKMLLGALRDDRTPESDRLLAVELAITMPRGVSTLLAAVFFAIALFFVYRSFYGMRIKSGESGVKAKAAESAA